MVYINYMDCAAREQILSHITALTKSNVYLRMHNICTQFHYVDRYLHINDS